jgi:hypothetical protein
MDERVGSAANCADRFVRQLFEELGAAPGTQAVADEP